ncbi:outer membrane lipoprotein-sorting protein [Rhodoferax aquaticus]|uniref:Outer membrane lipoprotein-sorting protein n=1 Tax=Rhodoferax aquaticus TaxID=2527691 RepID=A0A515EQT6_9BURK|nr:outer membrane lipoprotein-sorting protein [Rhodoferax aquaticus]QDL55022.1 outer membrane lipoprotein-sorting protein [Rhodoferax aquaticus]
MKFAPPWLVAAVLAAALPGGALAQTPDVATMLKAADKFRASADNLQVETQITVLNADGSQDKERRYTVFAQAKRQSLVLMQSPAEKGQKVLMLGDDFWLLMPNSQRPLRITPMQKLLGDASTGDVATLSWADDYTGTLLGEEPCEAAGSPTKICWHLSLAAARKGVTYQRIELWVGKARFEPIKADLYVLSDKLAKQATFVTDKPSAPTMVTEMVLADKVSNHKTTHVRYLSRKDRVVPETWLNPMFLVKTPNLE